MAIIKDMDRVPGLTPTANRTDAYSAPEATIIGKPQKDGTMSQLAQALSTMEPKLNRFLAQQKEEITQEQIAEGVKLYNENRVAWKEFVTKNPEMAGANPHLQRGYRQAHLENQGILLEQTLEGEYKTNPTVSIPGPDGQPVEVKLQNSDDPRALTNWLNQRTSQWIKDNIGETDPLDFAQHLGPSIQRVQRKLSEEQTEVRRAAYVEGLKSELGNKFALTLDSHYSNLTDSDEGIRQQGLLGAAEDLMKQAEWYVSVGGTWKDANALMVKHVIGQAIEHEDPRMLETLKYIKTQGGYLGDTSEAKAQINAAKEHIDNIQYTKWLHEVSRREDEIKLKTRELLTPLVSKLEKSGWNFSSILSDPRYQTLKQLNPDASKDLMSYANGGQNNMYDAGANSPTAVKALADIYAGRIGPEDIIKLRLPGRVMTNLIDKFNYKDERDRQSNSRIEEDASRQIQSAIVKGDGFGGATQESVLRGASAVAFYNDSMIVAVEEYRSKNGGKSPSEAWLRLRSTEVMKDTMQRFGSPDAASAFQTPQELKQFIKGEPWRYMRVLGDEAQGRAALMEYNKTGGKSGAIAELSARTGIPVAQIAASQAYLYGGRPALPGQATPGQPGQPEGQQPQQPQKGLSKPDPIYAPPGQAAEIPNLVGMAAGATAKAVGDGAKALHKAVTSNLSPRPEFQGKSNLTQVDPIFGPLAQSISTGWDQFLRTSRRGTNLDDSRSASGLDLGAIIADFQAMTPAERKKVPPSLRQQIELIIGPQNKKE